MYFRELPEPLCTLPLYPSFMETAKVQDYLRKTRRLQHLVFQMPSPNRHTLSYLINHLSKLSSMRQATGMTSRNLAIVWAPNLLRPQARNSSETTKSSEACLQDIGLQAHVIEILITQYSYIFNINRGSDDEPKESTVEYFTREVSIDQEVERKTSKQKQINDSKMERSRSCVCSGNSYTRGRMFKKRGVTVRRKKSIQNSRDNFLVSKQLQILS